MEKKEQEANDTIQDVIKRLNLTFPGGEFSFGYLFDAPCPVEQQQWYVFTQVPLASDGLNWPGIFPRRHRYEFKVGSDIIEIHAESQGPAFHDWLMRLIDDYQKPRHLAWLEKCGKK